MWEVRLILAIVLLGCERERAPRISCEDRISTQAKACVAACGNLDAHYAVVLNEGDFDGCHVYGCECGRRVPEEDPK